MGTVTRSVTFAAALLLAQTQTPAPPTPAQSIAVTPTAVTVTTAAELTEALKTCKPVVKMAAGTFVGNFTIACPVVLTGAGQGVTFIAPLDRFVHPLQIDGSNVTVQDLTVHNGAPDRDTVIVGRSSATSADQQPRHVTLERVHVAAGASGGHRGIALHGAHLTVRHSRVTNFYEIGRDSQAIMIHNGPGPYTIEHNYVEASGENILVGGDTVRIPGMVPADIVIRGNTAFKPDAWRTNGATVKIGIELKMGRRVLIEDNVVDGNWRSGQVGTPIVLTTRNQYGDSPWVVIDDVIVRRNVTKRCAEGFAVTILGRDDNYPSGQTQKILIERNLFTDSPRGFLISNGVSQDLTIRHNTLPAITGTFLAFTDDASPPRVITPLTFTNNVLKHGEYGMNAGDFAYPQIVTFKNSTGNVIERDARRTAVGIPAGQTWVEPGQLAARLDPVTFKLKTGTAGY